MSELRKYIKNDCKNRKDGLHCNYYKYGRDGVECPCLVHPEISDGVEFEHLKEF